MNVTLEEELREGGEYGDGCTCTNCRAADRIRALEADIADVAKINVDLMKRNRGLEAALLEGIKLTTSALIDRRIYDWHVSSEALMLGPALETKGESSGN